jgi:hypothetical protein
MPIVELLEGYFLHTVVPWHKTFVDDINDPNTRMDIAMLAAITSARMLYRLRTYVPKELRKTPRVMANNCPDYDILKHVVRAARRRKHTSKPASDEEIGTLRAYVETTKYEDADGPYFYSKKRISILLNVGMERDLAEVLRNVLNFWSAEFADIGITDSSEIIEPADNSIVPSREDAARSGKVG